jgi:hypothetical protein
MLTGDRTDRLREVAAGQFQQRTFATPDIQPSLVLAITQRTSTICRSAAIFDRGNGADPARIDS